MGADPKTYNLIVKVMGWDAGIISMSSLLTTDEQKAFYKKLFNYTLEEKEVPYPAYPSKKLIKIILRDKDGNDVTPPGHDARRLKDLIKLIKLRHEEVNI